MAKIFILFVGIESLLKLVLSVLLQISFVALQVEETSLRNLCMPCMQLHPLSGYLFLTLFFKNISLAFPSIFICESALYCLFFSALCIAP